MGDLFKEEQFCTISTNPQDPSSLPSPYLRAIRESSEQVRSKLGAALRDITRYWHNKRLNSNFVNALRGRYEHRFFWVKMRDISSFTISPRSITISFAVLVLLFTAADFVRPHGAGRVLGIIAKDFEVRAEKSKIYAAEAAIARTSSSSVFINAASVFEGIDEKAIGGATPEPTLVSTQYTALLGVTPPLTTATSLNTRTQTTTYIVETGDTPSVIAARFGITTNTLLWSNDLSAGELIRPGDELVILPINGVMHEVRSGDTVSSIAARYDAKIDNILGFNDIDPTANIVVGQTLIIPDGKVQYSTPKTTNSRYSTLPYIDGYFGRPTAGRISQGLHVYNAVDIAGGCWQPIYAAAPGIVSIASGVGRWNGGFGNFVMIRHGNGTETLYAHLVQVGTWAGKEVGRGELIGYTGSTGRSTGCHLHWEVHGAQNPLVNY